MKYKKTCEMAITIFNPLRGALYAYPPAFVFLPFTPLLKISLDNPYLKILDLSKHFVLDAPLRAI